MSTGATAETAAWPEAALLPLGPDPGSAHGAAGTPMFVAVGL
jgi:hypothetical protein